MTVEVGSYFWRSTAPKPLLNTGPPRASCPGPCPDSFWVSPGIETPQPFGAICASALLCHLHSEKKILFYYSRKEFLVLLFVLLLPLVPSPGTERSLALSSTIWGIRYSHTLICPLEPSLLQAEESQLSQLLLIEEILQFIISVALCWAYSWMSMSFFNWRAQNWTQYCRYVSLELNRREGSHPSRCWWWFFKIRPDAIYLPCFKDTLLAYMQLVAHQEPPST